VRIAIISDLHANKEALEAVFAHIREQSVDKLYCLGDVVGYGPDPDFCVDLVRGHAALCLMGNHDEALFRGATDFNPHARGAIEYTQRVMRPHWYSGSEKRARWKWIEELPLTHQEGRFLFVHGSPRDPVREYVLSTDGFLNPEKLRAIFDSFEGIAVGGHTHHPGMHDESLRLHGLEGR
jgi:predicted phosphodiesterase